MRKALKVFPTCAIAVISVSWLLNQTQAKERLLEGDGVWTKAAHERLTPPACRQTWTCGPDNVVQLRKNEEVTFTHARQTDGTCVERGANACRTCDATPPPEVCRWKVVSTQNN